MHLRQEMKEKFKPSLALPVLTEGKVTNEAANTPAKAESKWPTSYMYQLKILSLRAARTASGEVFTFLNFVQAVALAVIVGLLYLQLDRDEDSIPDRDGV